MGLITTFLGKAQAATDYFGRRFFNYLVSNVLPMKHLKLVLLDNTTLK